MSSPGPTEKGGDPKLKEQTNKARDALSKQLEECKDVLLAHMVSVYIADFGNFVWKEP